MQHPQHTCADLVRWQQHLRKCFCRQSSLGWICLQIIQKSLEKEIVFHLHIPKQLLNQIQTQYCELCSAFLFCHLFIFLCHLVLCPKVSITWFWQAGTPSHLFIQVPFHTGNLVSVGGEIKVYQHYWVQICKYTSSYFLYNDSPLLAGRYPLYSFVALQSIKTLLQWK